MTTVSEEEKGSSDSPISIGSNIKVRIVGVKLPQPSVMRAILERPLRELRSPSVAVPSQARCEGFRVLVLRKRGTSICETVSRHIITQALFAAAPDPRDTSGPDSSSSSSFRYISPSESVRFPGSRMRRSSLVERYPVVFKGSDAIDPRGCSLATQQVDKARPMNKCICHRMWPIDVIQ